jgi:hypothetical protein
MTEEKPRLIDYAKEIFLHVPDRVEGMVLAGRALVYIGLFAWGMLFVFHSIDSTYAGQSFLHGANLIFHEAGHVIFSIFGDFVRVLGGSLGQLLMPLIVLLVFLLKTRDTFGASVALWWFGENFIDLAPYINDARAMNLLLVGGITGEDSPDAHDWQNLLYRTNLLPYDHAFAKCAHYFGSMLIFIALIWGAYLLFKQYQAARA